MDSECVGQQRSDAVAHDDRGVTLHKQGKRDEAITAYRAAIRLKHDLVEAHYNLGLALGDQGKLEEAIAEFRKARENAPSGAELARVVERALTAAGH